MMTSEGTHGSMRRWHLTLIFGIFRGLCGPIEKVTCGTVRTWHMSFYRCWCGPMTSWHMAVRTTGSCMDVDVVGWLGSAYDNVLDEWKGDLAIGMLTCHDTWLYRSDVASDVAVDCACWLGCWLCGEWTVWANHMVTRGRIRRFHVARHIFLILAKVKIFVLPPRVSNPSPLGQAMSSRKGLDRLGFVVTC